MAYYKVYCTLINEFVDPEYVKCHPEDIDDLLWMMQNEVYEGYAGLHGIPDEQDLIDEYIEDYGEEPDESILNDLYCESVENWINGYYEEISEEEYNKLIE